MSATRAGWLAAALALAGGAAADAERSYGVAAKATVRVAPATAERGDLVRVTGRHWPRGRTVRLLIGPPRSEADPVGSVRTRSDGTFSRRLRLSGRMRPGRYVLLACRRECRDKAQANFRVTR